MRQQAASVVLCTSRGLVLAIERRGNGYVLPGGLVEPGEDAQHAAARELQEETGYRALRLEPLLVLRGRWWQPALHVFFAAAIAGSLRSSEEGRARWVRPAAVCSGGYGATAVEAIAAARGLSTALAYGRC